jgi:hypothetical protein
MIDLQTQLMEAKRRLSQAAQDCLAGVPGAAEAANQARAEFDALLLIERTLGACECRWPGCRTLTVDGSGLCARHRPRTNRRTSEEREQPQGGQVID